MILSNMQLHKANLDGLTSQISLLYSCNSIHPKPHTNRKFIYWATRVVEITPVTTELQQWKVAACNFIINFLNAHDGNHINKLVMHALLNWQSPHLFYTSLMK